MSAEVVPGAHKVSPGKTEQPRSSDLKLGRTEVQYGPSPGDLIMTTDTETPRIKYSPGLGGWTIYQGYEFINGAFAQRETAEAALAKLLGAATEPATCPHVHRNDDDRCPCVDPATCVELGCLDYAVEGE